MKATKTALFDAAKRWEAGAVRVIVGAVPALATARDLKGRQALHMACAVDPKSGNLGEKNGTKTAAALLAHGAPLEAVVPMDADEGEFRANPLWYAVSRGRNLALVRFLLKQGADASYSLWSVVFRNDAVMCRELLGAKPRLDLVAHGETPIFFAARLKRLNVLPLLIEAGADPTIKDPKGRDAIDIARARRLPKDLIARLEELKARR